MARKNKKHNRWKTAFIILLILIILFFWWALSDDSEVSDDYHGNSGNTASQSGNTGESGALFTSLTIDEAVRNPLVTLKGNGKDTVTVLLYMNGSNLETEDGEATEDLTEMVNAGSSDKVNFLVQTMNTKKWSSKYGISSKRTERYKLDGNGLKLVDSSLSQLSCMESSTLEDFIKWGVKNYPADRYILLFWNHGGGPVYGFGYDDLTESEDVLSTDEIQTALRNAGVCFDFIGMDCCIMSCMELCCALYDFCDYMILSEDFESGYGWSYTNWLRALYANTSISTPELATKIIDDMVSTNRTSNEDAILALIDESYMKVLYTNWLDFAYANEDSLLGTNYSRKMTRRSGGRIHPKLIDRGFFSNFGFGYDDYEDDYAMSDYYVTDIMALAGSVSSSESQALSAAVNKAVKYVNSYGGSSSLTGLSVTLPYGDNEFYSELKTVFSNCGFDSAYINWLNNFVSSSNYNSFYNYDSWDDEWSGWDNYEDDYNWDNWGFDWGSNWDDEYYDYYYGHEHDDYGYGYNHDDYYDDDYSDWFGWSDDDWYDDYYEDDWSLWDWILSLW